MYFLSSLKKILHLKIHYILWRYNDKYTPFRFGYAILRKHIIERCIYEQMQSRR